MEIQYNLKKKYTVLIIAMFLMIAITNAVGADQSSIPVSDRFDFPVGAPNGEGYNHVNGWDFLDYTNEKIYHPGEDWNGNGGGDSDKGDPVYAVSNGQIIAAGNYGKGWGNIILIQHLLPDGTSVWSQYAHLDKMMIDSGNVVRGQQIGTIGKGYNNEYIAHLHFEIRKEYRSPNAWVSGWTKSKVRNYYYDPSEFINSHRQLEEPISEDLIPLAGDMYNDGKDITGIFNPDTNEFTFNGKTVTFGIKGDLPVIGDWNGDGYDEIGVYRPDQDGKSYFYLITRKWNSLPTSVGAADKTIPFGSYPKDIPIVGDWDGNSKDDVGGFLSENAKFYLYTLDLDGSKVKPYKDFSFGNPGDIPFAGDWDGNGKDEIGIFRYPYPDNSNTNAFYFVFDLNNLDGIEPVEYGNKEDYPLTGDWDGDNDDNIGVYRPATNEFMKDNSIPKAPPIKPVADFTANPTSGKASLKVQFNDESTGEPTIWYWDFGDGETSTEQNPAYTYTEAGTYTVTLTVSNEAGESKSRKSNYITVDPAVQKPVAIFSASPTSGKTPLKVQFNDESTGEPTIWYWDFGDGETSTEQNPVYTYTEAGTYTVTITVSNEAGESKETKSNYITVDKAVQKPVADFTANPTSGNAPLKVNFIDESKGEPTTWYWDFGDGETSTEQNPVYTYIKAGTYTVKLTASNAGGSNTVTKSKYLNVTTAAPKPIAAFSATPTSGNVPLKVKFTDKSTGSPTSWKWNFGDGTYSTKQNPSYTYYEAGKYTVSLTVENAAGTSTKTIKNYITVNATPIKPVASFSASPTSGNAPLKVTFTDKSTNSPTSWKWTFGDGKTSTLKSPAYTYSKAGKYTISLTVKNAAGTSTKTIKNYITVNAAPVKPVASFSASPTSGKAPLKVQFTDKSTGLPTSWKWSFGDGTYSTKQNPSYTYDEAGKYTVSLTVKNAAGTSTKTIKNCITVNAAPVKPVASFSASPTSGNAPLKVQFTDKSTGSPTSWKWNFGDGKASTAKSPAYTYSKAGKYTVSLTVKNAAGTNTKTIKNYIVAK